MRGWIIFIRKLIEDSPSPGLPPEVRDEMGVAAKKLVKAAGYTNAGTVEFIVDKDFNFYFIEVNTRIQVEHPVTEMVTGVDLIKEQIRLARGERLGMTQDDIKTKGVAIECRINAEDPADNFRPCPGKIGQFRAPGGYGVRLDTHAYAGYTGPPNYDSMIAKLIVYQETREEASNCMRRCLDEFVIEGISTTIPLAQEIFKHLNFVAGKVNTGFIEEYFLD